MIRAYTSDDYAGAESGTRSFYYGYEHTLCKLHGKDKQCECDNNEWCFVAFVEDAEVHRLTKTQIESLTEDKVDECYQALLIGIMDYFNNI